MIYRTNIKESNNKLSADAGAEVIYFLLHLMDRTAYQLFGSDKANKIYENIHTRVINEYSKAIVINQFGLTIQTAKMLNDLNQRQNIYVKCKDVFGDPFPYFGTMIFALSFYIYKSLGKTNRENVDDILCGKTKLQKSDLVDFPGTEALLKDSIIIANIISELKLKNLLKSI